ncbi:MAG: hypothetical protein ACO1RA_07165 [Planctomycetaceae bacterium]
MKQPTLHIRWAPVSTPAPTLPVVPAPTPTVAAPNNVKASE